MNTKIKQAEISAPIVINQAEAKVNSTLATNEAAMQAYFSVTKSESTAYKAMKVNLDFNDKSMLKYIKVKAINTFNQKQLIIGV